jgi:hypothetical protein
MLAEPRSASAVPAAIDEQITKRAMSHLVVAPVMINLLWYRYYCGAAAHGDFLRVSLL